MASWVPWIKALHVISVIAWMAGMLYLPRLFVYHANAAGETSETFKVMDAGSPPVRASWVSVGSGPGVRAGSQSGFRQVLPSSQ
jgi:hypothetical protein